LTLDCREERPRVDVRQYWDVPRPQTFDQGDEQAWLDRCSARLHDAVETRLMSDVPLGVFLSGGVDSSTIAALMTRMVPGPVKTFSVGYAEGNYSELGYARQVSEYLRTDHHEILLNREGFFEALPRFIWHEDEPITWPSSISLGVVAGLASKHVKVVLTGEGGDELFAGYARYHLHLINHRLLRLYGYVPAAVRRRFRTAVATSPLLSANLRRKLGHTVLGRGPEIPSLYLDNFYAAFPGSARASLLPPGNGSGQEAFLDYWSTEPQPSLLARMLYADQKTYLIE
ncbi:MAG: asparagine synthase, partial [bacterium]|nr:asparagine synthase [bacterium]